MTLIITQSPDADPSGIPAVHQVIFGTQTTGVIKKALVPVVVEIAIIRVETSVVPIKI
jgi:hypothetical protein